jgi:hypothetical protein
VKYVLLIYGDEQAAMTQSPEQQAAVMEAWFRYTNEFGQSGKMLGGEALEATTTATTVRGEGGRPVILDGPFAETKEQLGGFYIIEASDLDEAIAWAGRMPHVADGGAVEVRPIWEYQSMRPMS